MARNVLVIFVPILFLQLISNGFAWGGKDKVLLEGIKVLTLKHGSMTAGRRSSPVPQLKCVGGSARCEFSPRVVQCYNKGSDGSDIQWECKTDMDNAYRFGDISVTCEGYDYPDDPYVLKGSCGLEYTIDLTKEGMQNAQYSQDHSYYGGGGGGGADYGWKSNLYKTTNKSSNFITNLACGAVVVVIVYAIYKTCIAPANETQRQRSSTNDDYHGRGPGSSPPPPGFRTDYNPGSGSDSGFYGGSGDSCNANRGTGSTGFGRNAGGFWTGAAAGGLLGYMFGNRNNDTQYGGATYRARPSTSGFSSGGWGGGYSGSSSSSSFGSSSSGTRTASGFGGTSRR